MIDSPKLALTFLEEARFFGGRMQLDDATDVSSEERFTKLIALHPIPGSEQIGSVLEEGFWAALLTEEGRPCRPRLLYSPRQECMRQAVHRFVEPVPLTRESLRKLMPAQG